MTDDDFNQYEIKITNDAIERIKRLQDSKQKQFGPENNYCLKIYIDSGGCSGF